MNKEVSFPIAKLLKEKRQNIISSKFMYASNGKLTDAVYDFDDWCFAPTVAEVVMWLCEKHLLWIYARKDGGWWSPVIENYYDEDEQGTIIENLEEMPKICFNSPVEAYEAAFEHALKRLI